jgi:hypothetical protein
MTNLRLLASKLAKAEGKKKQSSIGNVREVLARLCDVIEGEFKTEGHSETLRILVPKRFRGAIPSADLD